MAKLPTILPFITPPKERSTWKYREREQGWATKIEALNENESSADCYVEDSAVSGTSSEETLVRSATSFSQSSITSITATTSTPSISLTDHDYCFSNIDSSSQQFMDNLKQNQPFYLHYLETLSKAAAFDKAISNHSILTLESIKDDDNLIRLYTGLPNYQTFLALSVYLEPKAKNLQYYGGGRKRKLADNFKDKGNTNKPGPDRQTTPKEELFMVLYRLRLGIPSQECANRFGLKSSTYESIFNTWVVFLALELEALCKINADVRVKQRAECFEDFPEVVIVLDCTELFAETPSSLKAHKQLFSNYKHHSTVKFLVGISPCGAVTFISSMFGGLASDKFITRVSDDLLNALKRGENVMGDRAYTIQDELPPGVKVITPHFKPRFQTQFSQQQVQTSQKISKARVHVERAIGRIKSFGLLEREVKVTSIHHFEYVFKACAYLVNFQPPFLKITE